MRTYCLLLNSPLQSLNDFLLSWAYDFSFLPFMFLFSETVSKLQKGLFSHSPKAITAFEHIAPPHSCHPLVGSGPQTT